MTIYKVNGDSKYHLVFHRGNRNQTECGILITIVNETRTTGQKGNEKYPDPLLTELCPTCFAFLPDFQNLH